MGGEELACGDEYFSDDSSFYGDDETQEELLLDCKKFNARTSWAARTKDLNTILAKQRAMPPPDLHNIYQGRPDSWQMGESVDDFLKRLPPATTSISIAPWIWVANPYPEGRDRSGRSKVQDELIPQGMKLLERSLQERSAIRKQNAQKNKLSTTRLLNQQSERLKQQIADLANEANILSGKWMLFPAVPDLTSTWRQIVEGTVNDRLGSAAKVATTPSDGGNNARLICVYTKDFRDTKDVLRVLQELSAMGLISKGRGIYYKSDAYTYLDIYGSNAADYGLQASMYASNKMLA